MTTTVRVTAHCTADKEVVIEVSVSAAGQPPVVGETFVLQDKEVIELYAYDTRTISVTERAKE